MLDAQFYVDDGYQLDELDDLLAKCCEESEAIKLTIHNRRMELRKLRHEINELNDLYSTSRLKIEEIDRARTIIKRMIQEKNGEA